jgi:hypothetical protein
VAFDYTTPANVFAYLGSAGTGTDPINEADEMQRLITGMSRAVDQYCNQMFSAATYTDQDLRALIDAEGALTCYPKVPVISAISAASYRRGSSSAGIDLSAAALDIEQNTFGCVVRASQGFADLRGQRLLMRLSYTGGYADLAALPADFVWAMDALCGWSYQKRSAPIDRTAIPEFGMIIPSNNWPSHIKQMFKNYIRQVPM